MRTVWRSDRPSRPQIRLLRILVALSLIAATVTSVAAPARAAPGDRTVVFDDGLRNGFQNWSWAEVDLASQVEVAEGTTSIAVTYDAYEGLYFGRGDTFAVPANATLTFAVHGGTGPAGAIGVNLIDTAGNAAATFTVTPSPGAWSQVAVPVSELGGLSTISGLWFQDSTGSTRPPIHIDNVSFVEGEPPAAQSGPALTVDTGQRSITRTVTDPATGTTRDRTVNFPHAISEGIYGMNFVPDSVREELAVPVNRWGGNSIERYNNQTGVTSLANDWYFQNSPGDVGGDHAFETDNEADGADTIMTVPLIGWVADSPTACSYPLAGGATYDDAAPHNADGSILCGNGRQGGELVGSVDPNLTSIPFDEADATALVQNMVATHGNAAAGGVETYALGNEPGLWHATHGDIRATPIGRDEIVGRNVSFATAIKSADSTAQVAGPVLWSGNSYYVTSDEMLSGLRPGDVPTFAGDYLARMRAASDAAGTRLLDIFAVNFYDDRVYGGGSDVMRLESTRNLWDPSYAPGDWWVVRDFLFGNGSAVIPRLASSIDENYPGTDLAITEYNFGGNETIVGALAQADALGIFGREDLDTATIWDPYAEWLGITVDEYAARPVMHAFRLFRDYDGAGSRFGDQALYASSGEESTLAVHAARRQSDGAITVLVINKSTAPQNSTLSIDGVSGEAAIFTYSGADLTGIVPSGRALVDGSLVREYPARSATLLVIEPSGGEPAGGDDVMVATSCLADNGRVDFNIVNPLSSPATYRIELEGLSARQREVPAGDWWRMPFTGRADRSYSARVLRNGVAVWESTVTFDCDAPNPTLNDPEVRIVNACRDGLGYLLFQFVNSTDVTRPYVIEFDNVPNRSTSAAPWGQSIRAVTGRPSGEWRAVIRSRGEVLVDQAVTVDC